MLEPKKDKFMELNLQEVNDLLYILCEYHQECKQNWKEEGKPRNHVYHSFRRLTKSFPGWGKEARIVTT
jgi:hypothetical protein